MCKFSKMSNPSESTNSRKLHIVWRNVIMLTIYHLIALQSLYYIVTLKIHWKTILWGISLALISGQGITSGNHRLWAHRSYRARLPLRVLLGIFQTVAFQNSIYEWSRDHRVHHKFTDTDADPHNSSRGFFFSHMGWLMVRKHPEVITKGKTVDMSDLLKDPVVRFQMQYYGFLAPIACFVVPTLVPWYFWKEDLYNAFATAGMLRYLITLHFTWLVNSAAHMWGYKPYDRYINPAENRWVSKLTLGEGWHNYHHVFPWDYKAAELDSYTGNFTTGFIDFMAKIGWAYGLKEATQEMVSKRIERTGAEVNVLG